MHREHPVYTKKRSMHKLKFLTKARVKLLTKNNGKYILELNFFRPYKIPNFIFGPYKNSGNFWSYKIIMHVILVLDVKSIYIFE
jgi:hypothetical protein